jgi:hypothetical protein
MDEDRLSVVVTLPNGTTRRWAGDERSADNVLRDLTFGTSAPGGFKDLSCSLLRDLFPQIDEALFCRVDVIGGGGQILWQGRTHAFPRQTGTDQSVSPAAVGYQAMLADWPAFREVYVDRTPAFESPNVWRMLVIWSGNQWRFTDPSGGAGGLTMTMQLAGGLAPLAEAWYDIGAGPLIKKVVFSYAASNTQSTDPKFFLTLSASPNRDGSGAVSSGDYHDSATSATNASFTLPVASRFAWFQWGYSDATVASATTDRRVAITTPAVYGNHGLTERAITYVDSGGATVNEPPGFLASDMIADVVARCAPGLGVSTGATGTVKATSFVVPHAAFPDPTTAADAIARINVYDGYDWLVYDGPGGTPWFYYQPAGTGVEWQARIEDGASLSLDGQTADDVYNGCQVNFTDALTGLNLWAGPPSSGFEVTSAYLEDTSPDNPVNAAGAGRKWMTISPGFPTNSFGAIQLGRLALAEANLAKRAGQVTFVGRVRHPTRGLVSVAEVRAGDSLRFTDLPDDVPRRIVETTYSHASRTLTASVNSSRSRVEQLLERLLLFAGLNQAPG